jgi:hypothetical protein
MVVYENGALTPHGIQRVFNRTAVEFKSALALVEIQVHPDRYRILAFDPYGPLPIMEGENGDDLIADERAIETIACRLSLISRARTQIRFLLRDDCSFLTTIVHQGAVHVSCESTDGIWEVQAKDPLDAYQLLQRKVDLGDGAKVRRPGLWLTLE